MKYIFLLLLFLCTSFLSAQTDTNAVKSIEGITNKVLEILSGPQGEERDWDLYRSLFTKGATMNVVMPDAPTGRQLSEIKVDDFISKRSHVYARDGFLEVSIGLTVHEFNGIAIAFQAFECENGIGTYKAKGINSYQLVFADDRWWISNLSFSNETEESKIPDEYLKQ